MHSHAERGNKEELPGEDLCPQGAPVPQEVVRGLQDGQKSEAMCPSMIASKLAPTIDMSHHSGLMLFAGTAVAPTLNGPIAGAFSAIRQKGV